MNSYGLRTYDEQGLILLDSTARTPKLLYSGSVEITDVYDTVTIPVTVEEGFIISSVSNSGNQTTAGCIIEGNQLSYRARGGTTDISHGEFKPTPPSGTIHYRIYDFK